MKVKIIILSIILTLALPTVLFAQSNKQTVCSNPDTVPCGNTCIEKTKICLNIPIGGLTTIDINAKADGSNSFGTYLQAWYSFIIGSIGVIATVMMMWGGFRWLTSRGNSGTISDAKQIIWSALTGVVLAFLSYSILYFINPATTRIGLPRVISHKTVVKIPNIQNMEGNLGNVNQKNTTGATGNSPICTEGQAIVDFSNAPAKDPGCIISDTNKKLIAQYASSKDSQYILQALMATESSCDSPKWQDSGEACGAMQIKPSTAIEALKPEEIASLGINTQNACEKLKADDALSIMIASRYIDNFKEPEGAPQIDNTPDIFASYNAGLGTGQGQALGPSKDCEEYGVKSYECCINPGGLAETQNHVSKSMSYYNYFKQ